MKIHILSDLHLEFGPVCRRVSGNQIRRQDGGPFPLAAGVGPECAGLRQRVRQGTDIAIEAEVTKVIQERESRHERVSEKQIRHIVSARKRVVFGMVTDEGC